MSVVLSFEDGLQRKEAQFGFEPVDQCETLTYPSLQLTGFEFVFPNPKNLLRHLTLNFNAITSLDFLSAVPALTSLNIQHNKVATLAVLPSTLRVLKCSHNQLTHLNGLTQMCPELEELWTTNNSFPHPGTSVSGQML